MSPSRRGASRIEVGLAVGLISVVLLLVFLGVAGNPNSSNTWAFGGQWSETAPPASAPPGTTCWVFTTGVDIVGVECFHAEKP